MSISVKTKLKPETYTKVFDNSSKMWSPDLWYNLTNLRSIHNYANDMLHTRGHVFLNEVYDLLGFDRTMDGQVKGWIISEDSDNHVDLTYEKSDDAIILVFKVDGQIYDKIEGK